MDKYFENILKQLQEKEDDDGHRKLLKDLSSIVLEAYDHEFHDFKNKKYSMPKMELVRKLTQIVGSVKSGDYDN